MFETSKHVPKTEKRCVFKDKKKKRKKEKETVMKKVMIQSNIFHLKI